MSQVSIIDIEGNHPEIPTQFDANVGFAIPIANVLEIFGDTEAAGSTPVHTVGTGNNITTYVQISQAIAASDATKIGLAAFDSTDFNVDANGFVSLVGGVSEQFVTDDGTVIATANIVHVNGGPGVEVIANPDLSNKMQINLTNVVTSYVNVNFAMSPYTVLDTDYFISVDSSGGPVTINLPNSTTTNREIVVKDRLGQSASNNITITTPGGVTTIDGTATYIFTDDYESIDILFHGTNYETF